MSSYTSTSFASGVVTLPPVAGDPPVTLKYFDSQPGRSTHDGPYTTIITVHGVGFNSSIWTPWLPYLPASIRLLSYNRRGYQGSSPIYEDSNPTPGLVGTTGRYLLDLLGFMKFAVEELGVPKRDDATRSGGVVFLGWSKGTVPLIPLLATLPLEPQLKPRPFNLPSDLSAFWPLFASHVRSILMYEPPGSAAGRPPSSDAQELRVSAAEIPEVFRRWVTKTIPQESLAALDESWEEGSVSHDFRWLVAGDAASCEKVAHQAFDVIPSSIGFGLIHGSNASEYCLDVANWLKPLIADQSNAATGIIPGAAHFAMVTHPQAFTDCVIGLITKLSSSTGDST